MPNAAGAGDHDPLARLRPRLLDPLVGGDAGANQRRRQLELESIRDMGDVIRIGDDVFGEATVPGIAAEFRVGTDRLPGRQAMLAVTASRVEPGHSDPIT